MMRLIKHGQIYGKYYVICFDSKDCPPEEKKRKHFVKCVDMTTKKEVWKRPDHLKRLALSWNKIVNDVKNVEKYIKENKLL